MQLLNQLAVEAEPITQQVQILISNNASTDDTENRVREFIDKYQDTLALCYFRQSENIGGVGNLSFLVTQANTPYCWSIADDDLLITGALVNVIQALQQLNQDDQLMLVRVKDIEEWDAAPSLTQQSTLRPQRFEIDNIDCLPFVLAAPFLASIIIQTRIWLTFLPQLEPYLYTDYTNWGVALLSAQRANHFHLLDQPCVRGNATMVGPSRIPVFRILVMGRIIIWHALVREPLRTMLKPPMLRLWISGWKAVVAGNTDELKTARDKWRALCNGISLLGIGAFNCLPLFFLSFVGSVPQRRQLIKAIRHLIRV